MHGHFQQSWGRRSALVGLVAIFAALAACPLASAHAILLTSTPANDAVLKQSPATVTLGFNEPVETGAFGSVRIYDGQANRVDSGRITRPNNKSVTLKVGRTLPQGTYTVTWHVVSADTHPVSAAFVFHVGKPGPQAAGVASQVLGSGAPRSVTVGLGVMRFLRFAFLLLIVGGLAMFPWALAPASEPVKRRLAQGIVMSSIALVVASILGIGFQGANAGAFGLGKVLDPSLFSDVLGTRFGQSWIVQAALAAGIGALALAAVRTPSLLSRRPFLGVALALAGALVFMPALSGHANVSGKLSFAADVLHVAAAAAWMGGLAFVIAALVLTREGRWPLAATVVPRFSAIAVVAVGGLLLGGVTNGYLQVRQLRGLWETTYGQLLIAKVALILPVLALGAYNNRYAVPRLRAQVASLVEQRRFLRMAVAEVAVVTAVLGVTAALVAEPPAKAFVAPTGPFARVVELGPLSMNFVVDPAKAGTNQVHLFLTDKNGRPAEVDEARVSARLPSQGIGPLNLRANRAGPGHYVVLGAVFQISGDWQLLVEARRGEFESLDQTLSVPIRKGS